MERGGAAAPAASRGSFPGYSRVCRAPRHGREGRRESPEPSGKAGSLEAPINSFAQEDLQGSQLENSL